MRSVAMDSIAVPSPSRISGLRQGWRGIAASRSDPVLVAPLAVVSLAIVCARVPGWLAPFAPEKLGKELLKPPSSRHWLGTDEFGRDILSRIIFGTRIELSIS